MVQNFVDTYPRFALTYRLSQAPHTISYQEDTFMKFRLPIFSRREFTNTTTSARTAPSLPSALFEPPTVRYRSTLPPTKSAPSRDERRRSTDRNTGITERD